MVDDIEKKLEERVVTGEGKSSPIISSRSRGVSVALFAPYSKGLSKSILIQKSWRKGDKFEKRTVSFFDDEYPNLKEALLDFFKHYEQYKQQ